LIAAGTFLLVDHIGISKFEDDILGKRTRA
jgi:hypothetical protein